ncbi:O-antigen ligase family protein [Allopontixanthobacter sp.]|uniref:O-antigen ligase family protein n=1 Tax=Allopontixanthobacter sp. TaxID=2906452 RepID=UPI002AB83ECE|nr:O-antigen ligase family protein [Allopontixanthobacter sp.]MDZ4307005.1 O-antigen ligase family protein [Allopontixanthobacter sp.]
MKVDNLVPWVLGLAPPLVVALSWSPEPTQLQSAIRSLSLPILAAEIFVIAFAVREKASFPLPSNLVTIPTLLLVILAWISASQAGTPGSSLLMTSIWTIHLLFGFSIASLWTDQRLDAKKLILALQVGFLITALLIVLFVMVHYRPGKDWTWALPGYRNIRHLGYYAAAIVGISAFGYSDGKKLAVATAVAAFFIAFWTVSRGAIAATMAGYLISTLLLPDLRKREAVSRFIACALAGLLLSFLFSKIYRLDGVGLNRLVNGDYSGRIKLWTLTLGSIKESPWFGWGEAQLRFRLGDNYPFGQPHNIILQILHAWGLIGLGLISYISLRLKPSVIAGSSAAMAPFALTAAILVALSFVDGSLYYVNSVFIFALCLGIVFANARACSSNFPSNTRKDVAVARPDIR